MNLWLRLYRNYLGYREREREQKLEATLIIRERTVEKSIDNDKLIKIRREKNCQKILFYHCRFPMVRYRTRLPYITFPHAITMPCHSSLHDINSSNQSYLRPPMNKDDAPTGFYMTDYQTNPIPESHHKFRKEREKKKTKKMYKQTHRPNK